MASSMRFGSRGMVGLLARSGGVATLSESIYLYRWSEIHETSLMYMDKFGLVLAMLSAGLKRYPVICRPHQTLAPELP